MPDSDPDTILSRPPISHIPYKGKVQLSRGARGRVRTLVDRAGTAALRSGQERADVERVMRGRRAPAGAPQAPQGAAGAPLGITAGFVTTAPAGAPAEAGRLVTNAVAAPSAEAKRRREGAPDRVRRRYELQDTARALLPEHRVEHCQCTPVGGLVAVNYHAEHGSASYGGLQTCGSMWACPVCAAKVGARRAEEVGQGAAAARGKGWHIYMLTLTLAHEEGRALADLHANMNAAYRAVHQGRRWELAKARYGIIGRITAREHTYGAHGWHPHLHVLIFSVDDLGGQLAEVESWYNRRWRDELDKRGEAASVERGTHLREADDGAEGYIAKLAGAWSLPAELAGGQHKAGRKGNRTPVQLLDAASRGDRKAGGLYQEYVAATAGTSWLQWTPGLRALVGLVEDLTDEEIAAEERTEAGQLVVLTAEQWRWVKRNELRGALLAEACSGDGQRVARWAARQGLLIEQWQLEYAFEGERRPKESST